MLNDIVWEEDRKTESHNLFTEDTMLLFIAYGYATVQNNDFREHNNYHNYALLRSLIGMCIGNWR